MNRYVRLGYLLPRVVALIALVLGLQLAAGWGLRRAVVDGGQAVTGAKIEIDKSAVALLDTRITLQGIRAADPRDPMRNLFEADVAEFDLDADALLRRTAVAERGVVRGLRFAGERATSGALDGRDDAPAETESWLGAIGDRAAEDLFGPWVDGLESSLVEGAAEELESVRLAERLAQEWPDRYQRLRLAATELRAEAEAFEQSVAYAKQNPLRHASFLTDLPARASALQQRLSTMRAEIAALPSDAVADRQRVAEAWRRDEQMLRDRLTTDQLDPKSLTSALIGERVTAAAGSLIDAVRWARKLVPADRALESSPARRGVDVRFVGVKARPDLLIRSLELDGVARLGGRPMEFVGLVSDLTTQPAQHDLPTKIAIRTDGPTPLEAWATLDRTGEVAVDELRVVCPSLRLPQEGLPLGEGLTLRLGPSVADLRLTMRLEGERLRGDLRVIQEQPSFFAESDSRATAIARRLGSALTSSLEGMSNLDTSVTIDGTLERPRFALRSNLGPVIAEAISGSFQAIAEEQVEKSLAGARRRIDTHLGEVEAVLAAATHSLPAELGGSAEFLQNLAGTATGDGKSRLPLGFQRFGAQVDQAQDLLR